MSSTEVCQYKKCTQPPWKETKWCKACHKVIWNKWRGTPPAHRVKREALQSILVDPRNAIWDECPLSFQQVDPVSGLSLTMTSPTPEKVINLTYVASNRILRCVVRYTSYLASAVGVIAKLWPRAR